MKIVAAAGAAAFALVTGLYLLFGSWGVNFPAFVFYSYSIQPGTAGGVADFWSVLASFLFVFVAGLFAFGWLGVAAMAAEATKYANFFLTQRVSPVEFLFALPQLLALTSASLLCEAASENAVERKKVLLQAGVFFVGGVALLLVFYYGTRGLS